MTISGAANFTSNSDLIAACFRLGYLDRDMKVLDPTYGQGNWWTHMKPKRLVKHDLELDGVDFRNLPHRDNSFDAVAYDPPYVSVGGRATTTIKEMYEAYGLTDAPTSPKLLQKLIDDGMDEMWRVTKPEGFILVKSMNYVSSGKLWPGTYLTYSHAAYALKLTLVDEFVHVKKSGGPQPKNRTRKGPDGERIPSTQQHARRNYTTLHVFQVPKRKVA